MQINFAVSNIIKKQARVGNIGSISVIALIFIFMSQLIVVIFADNAFK